MIDRRDVETTWTKSTRCSNSGCIEVARSVERVSVRDGKNPDGPVLDVAADAWRVLIAAIKVDALGSFDHIV